MNTSPKATIMPRYSDVHYQALEVESAARKLASATKVRLTRSQPKDQEFDLNLYNIAKILSHLHSVLAALASERLTLSVEDAGMTSQAAIVAAGEAVADAAALLPQHFPDLGR